MLVDIDWLLTVKQRLSEVNTCDINNITWLKDGKEVLFSEEDLDKFKYLGMNNTDIITLFDYKVKGC